MTNKETLEKANALISAGDYDSFLDFCTDDTSWEFVGEDKLNGKEAVRDYMSKAYIEPPKFNAEHMIAEGDWLTVLGMISLLDESGKWIKYNYCDVWRFRDGKLAELRAFVVVEK